MSDALVLFGDNWDDQMVLSPSTAPAGMDWKIESSDFAANASNLPAGFSFWGPQSGVLMFANNKRSRISVALGRAFADSPVEIRFKLYQNWTTPAGARFAFGVKDTASGYYYEERATTHYGYYGSGFHAMYKTGNGPDDWGYNPGDAPGLGLSIRAGEWNFIKFKFDPTTGIEIWVAFSTVKSKSYDDSSLTYTRVAHWSNFRDLKGIDQFYLDNFEYQLNWMVDDVQIDGDPWLLKPSAMQTIYQNGVPHTDKNGNMLNAYDPARSFLPRVLYHAWVGTSYDQTWKFTDFASAGFNCCHLWESLRPTKLIADSASNAGIQLITHYATDIEITSLKNHPAILGWYENEEPTGVYWGDGSSEAMANMQAKYDAYIGRRTRIKQLDPKHPVFILDNAWADPNGWWVKWNTSGDITSHDNYPINGQRNSLSFGWGIPESVSRAVSCNNQSKPMWFCAQAHAYSNPQDPNSVCEIPTPTQERCMIYTALIHGATGVLYFGLDSFVLRMGYCIGIAPQPRAQYGGNWTTATPAQLTASTSLWNEVATLNRELEALRPVILSPTATLPYYVYTRSSLPAVTENPIRTLMKRNPDGCYTLLLANIDNAPQRVMVSVPGLNFEARVQYGKLEITKNCDSIEMDCPAYDVRVIKLIPATPQEKVTIVDVKKLSDNTAVSCTGVVSAAYSGFFYIQAANMLSGIRVERSGYAAVQGALLEVTGTISTLSSGERHVAADIIKEVL